MAQQPCDKCGRFVTVERKQYLSWGNMKDDDKVFCYKCKDEVRNMILNKN